LNIFILVGTVKPFRVARALVQIAEAVENVGGILTLLWHPNGIINKTWWNLYLRALDYLKEKNVWFGAVREVGENIHKKQYLSQSTQSTQRKNKKAL